MSDITGHHTAEQAFRASEERYRGLAEQLVDGIFVVDSRGQYLDANDAGCAMLGYTLEQLKTLTVQDVIAFEELPRLPEQFRNLASGDIVRNEWCFKRKDGSTFTGELVARRLPDGRLQGVVRDLTEQKRSALALRRQLEFEQFLFELSRMFLGLPDEELDVNMERGLAQVGEFLEMDRVTLFELSRDRTELTVAYSWSAPGVMSVAPVIASGSMPWWNHLIMRGEVALASSVNDLPEAAAGEREYFRQQGIESAASISLRVSGQIAGAIGFVTVRRRVSWTDELVSQLRAIGEILWNALKRRQAMQALLATQAVVRESEERFRSAMNNVAAGVYTLDLDGIVTYVNPAAEAMFGWTNAELLGKTMHDVTHHTHTDGTPYPASDCPGLQTLQKGIELREHEDTFIRKDGSFFPVVFSASPLKKDGTTVGIVVGFRDDTLRRDAERAVREREALRASEDRYRGLAEQITDGIIITDTAGRPLDANRAACDLWGYSLDELRTLGPEDTFASENPSKRQEMLQRLANGEVVLSEWRFRRKNGSMFTGETVGRQLADGRIQAVVRDITRRKEAEKEVKRQAALIDLANNAIFVRDREGVITYWNDGATRCYGWSREEAVGAVARTLLQTQYPEPLERIVDVVTRTGYWEGELQQTCKDGRRIVVDSRWAIQHDVEGEGFGILEINDDITARAQAQAALRESEQQLQSYIDHAGDGIYLLDGDSGRILNANTRATQMLGYSRDELLLLSAPQIECEHPTANIHDFLQRTRQGVVELEGVHRRKDGSTFPVEIRMTSLTSPPHRIVSIVRDISERKRLEQERAQEAQRKDEFLAFLGHELRNPLAAIHTAGQVLSGDAAPAQRARMLDIVVRQTAMMRRLVDDLLELERIAHGQIELKTDRLDLAEVLRRATAALQPTIVGRNQELVLRVPSESVQFMADAARLDQIVGNLLVNASKYTGLGGRIELSGDKVGAEVIFCCKDNGQGIPLEFQQKIFEPFVRGPKTELGHGEASVGLGLALVKRLTELHGGTISVESAGAGFGSEFTVRLPLVIPPPAEVPRPARAFRQTRSIVIVEDNPNVAAALQAALEQAGHSVHVFGDGPSTLAGTLTLTPDVLVIDVGLPGMDGYEVAARLKQQSTTKHALYVAVSGFKRRGQAKGGDQFDHYFSKPVDVPALLAIFDSH